MFIENMYSKGQATLLCDTYKKVKHIKGSIIEIGCWEGNSTHQLANACYPEILICNDTWNGNIDEEKVTGLNNALSKEAIERDVFSTFKKNMNLLTKGNYKPVRQDCHEFLIKNRNMVKFCHIDACHDYESVKKTIDALKPYVVDDGILCGDDYGTANITRTDLNGGVEKAVKDSFKKFHRLGHGNFWWWKKGEDDDDSIPLGELKY